MNIFINCIQFISIIVTLLFTSYLTCNLQHLFFKLPNSCSHIVLDEGEFPEIWSIFQDPNLKENELSLPERPSTVHSTLIEGGGSVVSRDSLSLISPESSAHGLPTPSSEIVPGPQGGSVVDMSHLQLSSLKSLTL